MRYIFADEAGRRHHRENRICRRRRGACHHPQLCRGPAVRRRHPRTHWSRTASPRQQDYAAPAKTKAAAAENPGHVDIAEPLRTRVVGIRTAFNALFVSLATATTGANAGHSGHDRRSARGNEGRSRCRFVRSFPVSAVGSNAAELQALAAQSESLQSRYAALADLDTADLAAVDDLAAKPPQQIALLVGMARRFLGDDYVVLPRFVLPNAAAVTQAFTHRHELLTYATTSRDIPLPVEEWLHGVSLVRPTMHVFGSMRYTPTRSTSPTSRWGRFSCRTGRTIRGSAPSSRKAWRSSNDTIAMVQYLPQGFAAAGSLCGLLVDEWVETVPRREEVTGIAFNYNQPNSMPPAAILLAVTPQETGRWQWNHLAGTVLDTMERARLRAVEPDMIDTLAAIGTLLPSTLGEFSTSRTRSSSTTPSMSRAGVPGSVGAQQSDRRWISRGRTLVRSFRAKGAAVRALSRAVDHGLQPARSESADRRLRRRNLRAEIRDPLWMLTRQWQMGEARGRGRRVSGRCAAADVAVTPRSPGARRRRRAFV